MTEGALVEFGYAVRYEGHRERTSEPDAAPLLMTATLCENWSCALFCVYPRFGVHLRLMAAF